MKHVGLLVLVASIIVAIGVMVSTMNVVPETIIVFILGMVIMTTVILAFVLTIMTVAEQSNTERR